MKIEDDIPKHRSKKDTKRWCKGKPGREHKKVWVEEIKYYNEYYSKRNIVFSMEICEVCKKRFNFSGMSWFGLFGPGF